MNDSITINHPYDFTPYAAFTLPRRRISAPPHPVVTAKMGRHIQEDNPYIWIQKN